MPQMFYVVLQCTHVYVYVCERISEKGLFLAIYEVSLRAKTRKLRKRAPSVFLYFEREYLGSS